MNLRQMRVLRPFIALTLISLFLVNFVHTQALQTDKELEQALAFVEQNRLVDALPLLDKVGPRYLNDAKIQAHWGVAILANSVVYKDEVIRKKEVARGAEVLKRAKKLGTENVLALHYLDLVEQGGDIDSVSASSSKEVEDAIREGEAFFGRGQYDKALLSYERAYKLDPKSYNAAVFAGDCYYAQNKYKESESWFAKAVAIDPNREQAYRFWGDALANQGKGREALEKFANALIAEPNSRLVFNGFIEAVRRFGLRRSSPFVLIPSKQNEDEIVIDPLILRQDDGTQAWNRFTDIRNAQIKKFNAAAAGREFNSTVSEDVECLRGVVAAVKELQQRNKSIQLNKSLDNLVKLDALGMLDIYTVIFLHGENTSEFESFREKNRNRMVRFLLDYFADENQSGDKP